MVNIYLKTCGQPDCTNTSTFGVEGTKKTEFCVEHAPQGMVFMYHKTCSQPACTQRPSYGVVGTKKLLFCRQHAPQGMVYVRNKLCGHPNCTKTPCFGVEGTKSAKFCREHAPQEMVNVNAKTCGRPDCTKRPVFGVAGTKKRVFCSQHATHGMVDVSIKLCDHPNCTKAPRFGIEGTIEGGFRLQHATDDMTNRKTGRLRGNIVGGVRERSIADSSNLTGDLFSSWGFGARKRPHLTSILSASAPPPIKTESGERWVGFDAMSNDLRLNPHRSALLSICSYRFHSSLLRRAKRPKSLSTAAALRRHQQ
ncbi:unnamed protein product [Ectocarpus sp. 12 AP-2014]